MCMKSKCAIYFLIMFFPFDLIMWMYIFLLLLNVILMVFIYRCCIKKWLCYLKGIAGCAFKIIGVQRAKKVGPFVAICIYFSFLKIALLTIIFTFCIYILQGLKMRRPHLCIARIYLSTCMAFVHDG